MIVDNSRQLALVLFESLAPEGRGVNEAPKALGFRRSNAFVRIVDLSLAGRRLIDVAYFLAASEPEFKKEYRVDYGLFKWLLATTSDNRAHVKKLIREAQKAAIELNGPDEQDDNTIPWGAVPLMGSAFIDNGEFIFELSERLQKAIKNPQASHLLSLRYVFKSIYSKILYDRLQPFMDDGLTPWFDLESLRVWLECDKKTYKVFKHFRGRVLDVAVNEIADVTGLKIVMVTQNVPGSKSIGHVRFKWEDAQHKDDKNVAFVVLRNTYEILRTEFGLNQSEFEEITKNRVVFTDERIQQAIEYTRTQAAAKKIRIRAGGYFMKALREGYLIGSIDKQIKEQALETEEISRQSSKTKTVRETNADKEFTARQYKESLLGWEAFNILSPEEQLGLKYKFCKLPTSPMIARRLNLSIEELSNHLSNPAVSTSFGCFVANRVHKASKQSKGSDSGNLFSGK